MKVVERVMVVVAVVVMMVVMVSGQTKSCEPDCSGKEFGDLVPDPADCHAYFFCLGDNMHSEPKLPCENGTYFNGNDSACVEETTPCESECGGDGSLGCTLTCSDSPGFISSLDCSEYYICMGGDVQGPLDCPADKPFFDGLNCGTDDSNCCSRVCEPYCEAENTIIPNPIDCHRFYYCTEVGKPDENYNLNCPAGTTFNIQLGKCVAGGACEVICEDPNITGSVSRPTTESGHGTGPGESTSTSPSDCVSSLVCPSSGYFAACTFCQANYFSCDVAGEQATLIQCPGNLVFNPVLDYPSCIKPENCPYNPADAL